MLSLRERIATDNIALTVPVAVRYGLGIVVAAGCIALAAHVRISLPFSPVPITLQTAAVLGGALTLGAAGGGLSQLLYIGLGLLGAPAFAGGTLMGPTIGYILGFVPAAIVVGWAAHGGWRPVRLVGAMLVATALIYACGIVGLVATTGLSWSAAIVGGVLPFVPGDLLKVAAALGISRISIPAWSAWCQRQR